MVSRNSFDGIDAYAADLIRFKARQLIGKAGFTMEDLMDIEQELATDLIYRMRHYDPKKSRKTTFAARIVERHIATILESRRAQCRDWRRLNTSLNAPIGDSEDAIELMELLDGEGGICGQTQPIRYDLEIRVDVERALEGLPSDLREICIRLQHATMAEIAREMGIPRTTLYERLKRIREVFREAGLEEYL